MQRKEDMPACTKGFFAVLFLCGAVFVGCHDDSFPIQAESSLAQELLGTWYAAGTLYDGAPEVVFACTFEENDTLVQSLAGCSQETPYLRSRYHISGDTIVSILEFDTTIQSALEVFFAASEEGTCRTRAMVTDDLLLLEQLGSKFFFEAYEYSRICPSLEGAVLYGALSISNPAPDCLVRIIASDLDSDRFCITFLGGAAAFCIEGVALGRYHVTATYFTKSDAYLMAVLPFDSLVASGFYDSLPSAVYGSAVVVAEDSLYQGIDMFLEVPKTPGGAAALSAVGERQERDFPLLSRWGRIAVR